MNTYKRCLLSFAIVLITPLLATAATHIITQSGFTFSPQNITIQVGDTVQWNWSAGSHTVTSGTDLSDPQAGSIFDSPLTSINFTVSHTFMQAGTQNYFCRPHVSLGMKGSILIEAPSAVEETPVVTSAHLMPNSPNPFNPTTKISFTLPTDRHGSMPVSLVVYDLKGRLVRTLLNTALDVDHYTVTWDGRDEQGRASPSGAYIYRLIAAGKSQGRMMTLAK